MAMTQVSPGLWTSEDIRGGTNVHIDVRPRSELLVEPAREEPEADFFGLLQAEERLRKENSELLLEVHRMKAQLIQVQGLEEKVVRLERQEAVWKAENERLQAENDACEQRVEEERLRATGVSEQLSVAKAREEELLKQELAKTRELRDRVEQAKIDDVKFLALTAKLTARDEECEEAKFQLEKAEKVRVDLLRVLQERNAELEKLRQETKELREYERSRTSQVLELTKSVAVLEERVAVLKKELQDQESSTKQAQEDAEDKRQALVKAQEEARALQTRVCDFEAKLEQLRKEEEKEKSVNAQLREELARAESLASEREVALHAAQRREEQLNEQVAQQQSRADTAQAALLMEKTIVQRLESDLQAARAGQSSARSELERVRCEEEAARAELQQRADKKAAVEAARLGAEVERLEEQLQQLMEQLGDRNRSSAEMEVQLSRAGSRQAALEIALEEAQRSKEEAHVARAEAFRRLQELSHSEKAVMTSRRRFIERGGSPAARHGGQDELAATWRGDQGRRAPARRSASEPMGLPGRRLGMQAREGLESSSTFASSSKSDLLQEPMAAMEPLATLRPVTYEPIAGRREEPRRSRVAREPEPHIQEPRSREAASACGAEVPPWPEAEPQAPTAAPEPQKPPVAERPSDLVAALAPKDPLPPDAVELPILSAAPRKQEMPADPPPHIPEIAPSSSHQVVTQAMAQELSIAQSRIQARSLDAWHRHLTGLERWQLLSVVWRLWAGPAKVSALRARLELVLLDELRLAKAREEVQRELSQFLRPKLRSPELWPQVFGGPAGVEPCGGETSDGQAEAGSLERKLFIMKSFIFEFRKRVAEAVAELPGALNGFAEGQAFQTTLEIGRGSFGRLLHASLFLYQKLRTLVPSELEETMRDPVSRLVPVPFYVLPYKFRLAVHRGVSGLAHGLAPPRRGGSRAQLQELQDMMPLCASDGAVPSFLMQLLAVRCAETEPGALAPASAEPTTEAAAAEAPPAGVRDGLDQLVVDALTVYMSGWRISNGGPAKIEAAAAAPAAEPVALERRGRSLPPSVGRPQTRPKQGPSLHGEPKLRLGPHYRLSQ